MPEFYRQRKEAFSISYHRKSSTRLPTEAESEIEKTFLQEIEIVENPDLPVPGYNHTAPRDRLLKQGIDVSVTLIIDRVKKMDCHKPGRKRKVHDREMLIASIESLA